MVKDKHSNGVIAMKLSLLDIANKFSNDEVAEFLFRRALCKNSVTSPHWGSERFSERPRHDSPASHCTDCRKDFTSKSNTIMYTANIGNREQDSTMQCKCYAEVGAIKKKDIDPFFAKSSPAISAPLILVDTSSQDLGQNDLPVLENADQDSNRIQLEELENSQIDWLPYVRENRLEFHVKRELREHQIAALRELKEGLSKSDRGRLIVACGTGKTFTSLRIAEDTAGKGKLVLYMVPSQALMSQTVRQCKNDATGKFTAFSACSDRKVVRRSGSDDRIDMSHSDLPFPATFDSGNLAEQIERADKNELTVVFSTDHSIDLISKAQKDFGLGHFDLIFCDEAHKTTGVTLAGDDESSFERIHSNEHVNGVKCLNMTARKRIYTENAENKVEGETFTLVPMDDEKVYGDVPFHRGFGSAVDNKLLTSTTQATQ